MKRWAKFVGILWLLSLTACTTIQSAPQMGKIFKNQRWAIAPFNNNTVVPEAGSQAMSITAGLLPAKRIYSLILYQPKENGSQLLTSPARTVSVEQALTWAYRHNIRYLLMGSVNEWGYKFGLDGEPAVAVSLELYDVATGLVIWSSVGNRPGLSGASLGDTAQQLIRGMLSTLHVSKFVILPPPPPPPAGIIISPHKESYIQAVH